MSGLPDIVDPTGNNDLFLVKEANGENKKVTLENLRKWVLKGNTETSSNIEFSQSVSSNFQDNGASNATRYAVPNGAIVTFGFIP